MKKSCFGIIAFFVSITASGASGKLPVPEIETLPNGLQVVWFLSDQLPVVDLALLVKSGFKEDPAGKSGTAMLLSEMLQRGAGGLTAQQMGHAVEVLGASRVASVDEDTFSVGMHGLAPDAPALLDLMAKMALRPTLDEADTKREHARLLDRWNHLADYGESLVSLGFNRVMQADSVYGRGSLQTVEEFKKVGRDDLDAFYRKHFTPKNSILMVVGRVNKAEFRKQIALAFGEWKGEAPEHSKTRYAFKKFTVQRGQILVVDRPDLNQAQVRLGFKAPPINAPEHYALVVANALLGEYFNSRLNSVVRDKLALTYGIESAFSYSREQANFVISSSTRNEAVGQLIRKSMEVVSDLKKGPIPTDEVQSAKEYLVGGFPLTTSTLGSVAARWLAGYIYDLGPLYLNDFVLKVNAVTVGNVSAAVIKDFTLDRWVVVVAGDAKAIRKGLEAAGFHSIKQISARDLM